jgi:hypothetical protein
MNQHRKRIRHGQDKARAAMPGEVLAATTARRPLSDSRDRRTFWFG